jgi:prophage regulatory protein
MPEHTNFQSETSTTHFHIVRRPSVLEQFGISNTCLHQRIKQKLMPPSIPLGERSVGWLSHELDAVLAAMVAGKNKDHIRSLVTNLIDQRKNAA